MEGNILDECWDFWYSIDANMRRIINAHIDLKTDEKEMYSIVWDEIVYQFLNFNGAAGLNIWSRNR